MSNLQLSIVIPVYSSQNSLEILVNRLEPVLNQLANEYELIFVNDGSPDQSWKVIESLRSKHKWVLGINLMRNYGQHNALLAGIRAARFPIIITMDDDLQHPPEEIPKLLCNLTDDIDVVYGYPEKETHGLFRAFASIVTKIALQKSMGATTARRASAFRVFRTQIRDSFAEYSAPFVSIDVLLTWGTTRFQAVPVHNDVRIFGKSGYSISKLVLLAINMVTGFTVIPLQIASIVGLGSTIFGLGVLTYALMNYLVHGSVVPGFTFLASSIAIFSGAQLLSLGIIGEYLARMHFRAMNKPTYTVRRYNQKESDFGRS